jgi:transaldolase
VDTKVDKVLGALGGSARECSASERGQIAIANAKVAYEEYERIYSSERWRRLAAKGARPQRVLWGSTSTKNPEYPDLYYVEALIGQDTVDTMPLETFRAFIEHGRPEPRLRAARDVAHQHLANLASVGIDLARLTDELEEEGVQAFTASFLAAEKTIAEKRRTLQKTA